MTSPARALMPDTLRLVALFGIIVVNFQFTVSTPPRTTRRRVA